MSSNVPNRSVCFSMMHSSRKVSNACSARNRSNPQRHRCQAASYTTSLVADASCVGTGAVADARRVGHGSVATGGLLLGRARVVAQRLGLVGLLPGELGTLAAEVAV